jgi:hypothetical protein
VISSYINLALSVDVDPASIFSAENCSELILKGFIEKNKKSTDKYIKLKLDRGIA